MVLKRALGKAGRCTWNVIARNRKLFIVLISLLFLFYLKQQLTLLIFYPQPEKHAATPSPVLPTEERAKEVPKSPGPTGPYKTGKAQSGFLEVSRITVAEKAWSSGHERVAVYAVQGPRGSMEDRFRYIVNEAGEVNLFGVFDGHGGQFTADYTEAKLLNNLSTRLSDIPLSETVNWAELLGGEFISLDQEIVKKAWEKEDGSGSTVLVAIERDSELIVANVGDSRGVMCDGSGKAVPLSQDHKPNDPKEKSRIESLDGGFIAMWGVWRVNGVLATSRAFGDIYLKRPQPYVIPDPDIVIFSLSEHRPKFIILASDGLWDVVSNQEAVDFIAQRLDKPFFGAQELVDLAIRRGTFDNVTVMVVLFNP